MAEVPGKVLLDAALAVLLDQTGGTVAYTQAEYFSIKARRGPFQIVGEVDKTDPTMPVVRVSLRPSTRPDESPVS